MGVSTFSTGILVWKQSLRKCELYEADWHFKHRQSYCLSQTALPLYVCSGLCFFIPAICMYNKKNPRNFCGSPCWIGTYFTNVAIEKWSLDFLWFMKNLLREYTIFFLVSQKNIYTNNWKNLPCIQESLHSSGGGGEGVIFISTDKWRNVLAFLCAFMSIYVFLHPHTSSHWSDYHLQIHWLCWSHMHWSLHERQRNNWTVWIVRAHCVYVYVYNVCVIMYVYACVHVFEVRETEQVLTLDVLNKCFPSIKERKQGPLPRTLDFFTIFPALS